MMDVRRERITLFYSRVRESVGQNFQLPVPLLLWFFNFILTPPPPHCFGVFFLLNTSLLLAFALFCLQYTKLRILIVCSCAVRSNNSHMKWWHVIK